MALFEVSKKSFRKPFQISMIAGVVGFGLSVAGFQWVSFEAGMLGAVISASGLSVAAMIAKLYEKLFEEEITVVLPTSQDLIEVEE